MSAVITKVVGSGAAAIGAAYKHREHLKPVMEPAVMVGKSVGKVIWNTIWITVLTQIALGFVWVSLYITTYLLTQSTFMMGWVSLVLTSFAIFVLTPFLVFLTQVVSQKRKLNQKRAEYQVYLAAKAAAEAEFEAQRVAAEQAQAETLVVPEQSVPAQEWATVQ